MSQGRSIRLFLVDGTPNGLLTAEIMNWTGHVLTGPRSKLAELVQRRDARDDQRDGEFKQREGVNRIRPSRSHFSSAERVLGSSALMRR